VEVPHGESDKRGHVSGEVDRTPWLTLRNNLTLALTPTLTLTLTLIRGRSVWIPLQNKPGEEWFTL